MVAWRLYNESLCPGCGHPKATAWHPDNGGGWFEVGHRVVCHACTARSAPDKDGIQHDVEYLGVVDTRDYDAKPLPIIDPPEEE